MLEVGSAFRVLTFRNYTLVNPQVGSPRGLGVRHASSHTGTFGKRITSSNIATFGRRIASSDAVPFSLLISNSPSVLFLNLLPLAITTLKKKPLVTVVLILKNYTISNNKEKIKSTTMEEGDNIAAVTFFVTKP